jgi:hypothetical protein
MQLLPVGVPKSRYSLIVIVPSILSPKEMRLNINEALALEFYIRSILEAPVRDRGSQYSGWICEEWLFVSDTLTIFGTDYVHKTANAAKVLEWTDVRSHFIHARRVVYTCSKRFTNFILLPSR